MMVNADVTSVGQEPNTCKSVSRTASVTEETWPTTSKQCVLSHEVWQAVSQFFLRVKEESLTTLGFFLSLNVA